MASRCTGVPRLATGSSAGGGGKVLALDALFEALAADFAAAAFAAVTFAAAAFVAAVFAAAAFARRFVELFDLVFPPN